jgi:hypothetical protein
MILLSLRDVVEILLCNAVEIKDCNTTLTPRYNFCASELRQISTGSERVVNSEIRTTKVGYRLTFI